LKKKYDIVDEWLGLEIHPETPIEGVDLNKRFGKANLERMKENLDRSAAQYGLKFGKLELMPNSHNALEAAEYARSVGKLHEYHKALMENFFEHGKDIGDINYLIELGENIGLDREGLSNAIKDKRFLEKLNKDANTAHDYGINSTPTFIINDKYMITGAQPIEVFENALRELK